jgi:ATP synthase protein I
MKLRKTTWHVTSGDPLPDEENKQDINRKSGLAYAAAFSLFGAVVAGLIAGWLLDRWLGTAPWLLVAGIVLGAAAGFYEFVRAASKIN